MVSRYKKPFRWRVILIIAIGVLLALVGTCVFTSASQPRVEQLWSQPVHGFYKPPVLADGKVIVGSTKLNSVVAYSLAGEKLWEYAFNGAVVRFVPLPDSLVIQAFPTNGSIGVLDTIDLDGNNLTHRNIDIADAMRVGCPSEGVLVYFDNSECIRAVDTDFNALWSFPLPGARVRGLAVGPDNRVYFGLDADPKDTCYFFCLDSEGNEIWRHDTIVSIEAPPVFAEGMVFLGTMQELIALDDTGSVAWQFKPGRSVCDSPIITGDKLICATYDGAVHAFDLQGTRLWRKEVVNTQRSTKNVNMYLLPMPDGRLAVFHTRRVTARLADYLQQGLSARDGVRVGGLAVIDPQSGVIGFKCKLENPAMRPPVAGKDGMVYLIGHDEMLYAISIPE